MALRPRVVDDCIVGVHDNFQVHQAVRQTIYVNNKQLMVLIRESIGGLDNNAFPY